MRKVYSMILALLLTTVGAMNVLADKADLDPAMFKAWDGCLPGAKAVAEPENCPNSDGTTSPFGCDFVMYENVGAGSMIYGNTNVYYLWYADLTGTNTLTIEGTAGMQIRVLINRPEAEEGAEDPHGGTTTEINVTLDENGSAVVDFSGYEYVHLNAIKTGWGSPAGSITKLELDGSVKPVTGWVDVVNNADLEGDDVSSFFVALDATNDSGYYPATIVDGAGVNDSRGIVVQSIDAPSETWATQFFIKMNEPLPEGTQWRLSMDIKADQTAECGSGVHHEPRAWFNGSLFDPNPTFTPNWETFEASGVLDAAHAADDGLGSIAFDLNTLAEANKYYFDNIHFQIFKESSPVSLINATYETDAICIDFGKQTNLPDLIKAAGVQRIVYPNESATVTVNGEPSTLLSVEGRPDGKLYIFIDENYSENDDKDIVVVSWNNSTDPASQIVFTAGKYEGEPAPSFTNVKATYESGLASENFSYLFATPTIDFATPEDGSFNLPSSMNQFVITFDHKVDCKALVATLDGASLSVSPADGFAEVVTLNYSGGSLSGVKTLLLSNVKGEKDLGETGTYSLALSFGDVVIDPDDQPTDLIPAEYFANCPSGGIPEGFFVTFAAEERTSENTYGSGSRVFDFAAGGDFTKGLYFREGYVEYGGLDEHELALEAGKKYSIKFNTAMWKDNGPRCRFEILNEDEEVVFVQMIDNTPNVNGSYGAVNGSTATSITFVPDASGNYRLRWTAATSETGDPGFVEVLLANVVCKYLPNTLGVEQIQMLNAAIENAKTALDENSDERYLGTAFNALQATIAQYESWKGTSPSAYNEAVAIVNGAAQALKDHRTLCDDYEKQIKAAIDVVRQNEMPDGDPTKATKFTATPLFAQLKAVVAKYHGTSEWVNESEDPEVEAWVLNYSYDVLTDDAQLNVAVPELTEVANTASLLFTVGKSTPEGSNGGKGTGVAVATERLRLGAEALKALGVAEDNWLITAANNALTDDDALVNEIKRTITQLVYGKLKEAGNNMFETVVNEETLEEMVPQYDMTVFVKNPNVYKTQATTNYSAENVPGWVVPEDYNAPGLTVGWGSARGNDVIAEDCMFQTWGSSYRIEQTVTDLPAGIYTVKFGFGERMNDDEANFEDSYVFAYGSDGEEVTGPCPGIGQSFPFLNTQLKNDEEEILTITVTDGTLTFGVNAGPRSHTFFNDVQVLLVGAAPGYDYGTAYTEDIAGTEANARVRAITVFDLNGRRMTKAQKGVQIVKKQMSDGSIRMEKVVKK